MNGSSGAVLEIAVFVLLLAGAIGFGAYLGERNTRPWPRPGSPSSATPEPVDGDELDDWFRDLWWTR